MTSATAASLKTPHTLTVLQMHLAFVADARRRGDEHGHMDWTPEVFHAISDGERSWPTRSCITPSSRGNSGAGGAFVDGDHATMSSERLAAKLIG
ncbi:hypothetical protein ABZ614_20400 [Streptomyces sp. NPDC013178]|uniref:hypothetical protein n=1 Tax=Streptomyces sp. NPDC013178 TaxID=3155118 RepID=UPI0033D8B027